jgi:hypothetical protein
VASSAAWQGGQTTRLALLLQAADIDTGDMTLQAATNATKVLHMQILQPS